MPADGLEVTDADRPLRVVPGKKDVYFHARHDPRRGPLPAGVHHRHAVQDARNPARGRDADRAQGGDLQGEQTMIRLLRVSGLVLVAWLLVGCSSQYVLCVGKGSITSQGLYGGG